MNVGDFDLEPMASRPEGDEIRFERVPHELPGADRARTVVREALVPFVVWPEVPVHVIEPRKIGRMEAFLLEAALDLGSFDLVELEEATAVPWHVIQSSAERLLARRALLAVAPGRYGVDQEFAGRILKDRNIDEINSRWLTFVYFPRQDELLANPDVTHQLLRISRKLRAPRQAPFRMDVRRNESVREFLRERITEERVHGAVHRIVALGDWPKPPAWPELSPCYYARGLVVGAGDDLVADLRLWGHGKKRHAGQQYHCEPVKLSGASTLIREWVSLTERFETTFSGTVAGLPKIAAARLEPIGPCHVRLGVSFEDAAALAKERWLTEPVPVSIRSSTARVDVRLSLEPLTRTAADLFVQDFVARRIEEGNRPPSDTVLDEESRAARERYPRASVASVARSDIEDRLWGMKRFMAIYALREREDFAYG